MNATTKLTPATTTQPSHKDPNIKEIRIRKTINLSDEAQKEVAKKLEAKGTAFRYVGYAKVSYTENSPLSVFSVDPIEGDILDYTEEVLKNIQTP